MEPNNKKIIILAAIALFVVGGVLFLVFSNKKPSTKKPSSISVVQNVQLEANNAIIDKVRETDADLDGLTDTKEKQSGTDPKNPDTDGDGIMDSYEINITKTGPLKKDTDGDGLSDGYEVARLMDPLKKNKLK
ncbi:MAG: hypothetical protein Q7S24_01800 [bacterium]|nr:hypothetical protein [bacterium]